ncbi:MAG: trigger factor [Desulfobacterales bacterium]|jgi:trigger factor
MQVTVDDLSSVKKTLHIEIPEEEVVRELDQAYKNLRKTAKIKGFRQGKAPRAVLERRFKKDVNADVSSRLIQESLIQAIQDKALRVVGTPRIDPPELKETGPYQFTATVEINPEINDIDFKGLALKKTRYRVTDEEIDAQLKLLQRNMARLEPLTEERPAAMDDYVLIDYEGFENDRPMPELQKTENYSLKLGRGMISKDFDEHLVGLGKGEEREFTIDFASDHFNPKLAGKTISFKVFLHDIRKEILPTLDDEFAKKVGPFENFEALKQEIVGNLTNGYEKRSEQELNEQIFLTLLDKTDFEVPDALVDYELDHIIADAERSFQYHNMDPEQIGLTRDKMKERYRETAEKQVRRHLILSKIIDQEKLDLTDEELDAGFQQMADQVNQPAEQIKSFYRQDRERLDFFKHTLLEKKAIKLIIEAGSVEEVEAELEKSERPEDSQEDSQDDS